ncbi:LPS export ABC transporter permease LptG [bacterium]|nr:LPS export ABC transporter permease LptG [bacterium]
MKLLDRYIAKTVLAAIVLVTLLLTGLQVFILFVNQLGDLGKAHYGVVQAALYVLLEVPYEVYLFFPMASLLGCLIGLGVLANHRELVVMRASGMSIGQITQAVFKVALLVIIVVTVAGETFLPRLVLQAHDEKMQALSGDQALRTPKGLWLRYKNDFVAIGSILPNGSIQDINQFHFDADHHLNFARRIETIDYVNGVWMAHGVVETIIDNARLTSLSSDLAQAPSTHVQNRPEMIWDVALQPQVLRAGSNEADEMTLLELHDYLRAQKRSHQMVQNFQLVYWQRLIQPITTAVMMMLAIPFIFGPLRSSTMGSKLLAGAIVGFGFYIMNRFLGSISQVYQLPSIVAAIGPTGLFALLGLYLMRRVK